MKKQCKLSIQLHTEVFVQTMCQKNLVSVIKSSFTSINHIFRAQFYFFHYFNDYCYCASQHTSYFLCCEQKQREDLNLRAPTRVSERSTNNQTVPKLQASLKSFDCSRQGVFDWIKSNLIFCYCSILVSPVLSITIFLVHVSVLPHLCLDAEYLVSCLFIIITCCCCGFLVSVFTRFSKSFPLRKTEITGSFYHFPWNIIELEEGKVLSTIF